MIEFEIIKNIITVDQVTIFSLLLICNNIKQVIFRRKQMNLMVVWDTPCCDVLFIKINNKLMGNFHKYM